MTSSTEHRSVCVRRTVYQKQPPILSKAATSLRLVLSWVYCFFFTTWAQSYLPLITVSFTPGRSCVLPPWTSTTLCSWRLCPSPGIKTTASFPLDRRTLAHLRLAEFGFLGFRMSVFRMTAFIWGRPNIALTRGRGGDGFPRRCIWLSVAMVLERTGPVHDERDCDTAWRHTHKEIVVSY